MADASLAGRQRREGPGRQPGSPVPHRARIFGIGLIGLLLLLTDGLGKTAVATAALLTAISPAMVFYSRYYIQEMLLVFFTLAALGCGWRYL